MIQRAKLMLLLALLPGCDAPPAAGEDAPALQPVASVDLERYAGRWFEIARLPNRFQKNCVGDVTATYGLREDGRVEVVNRCRTDDGEYELARGVARVVDERSRARLEVRFAPALLSFLPAVWGDYWIIDLAPDYSTAVVGEPERRYLWILARAPRLDEATLQDLLKRIAAQGYDPDRLVRTPQSVEQEPAAPG